MAEAELKMTEWGSFDGEYEDLISSMDLEHIVHQKFGTYQGDAVSIVKKGRAYGLLIFGYGSCSGCDALEACSKIEDVIELRDNLYREIHWEPGRVAFTKWLMERDWEGQWIWHEDEFRKWLREQILRLQNKEI